MATEGNSEHPTVMGPAVTAAPRKSYDPPPFTADVDKFKWRSEVRSWARYIRKLAKNECTKSKARASALGEALYDVVDESAQHELDHAIATGILDLDPEENGPSQDDILETIMKIIAPDSPTESVKRISTMMMNIHACKRGDNEGLAAYTRRFRGLAKLYLNHSNSGPSTQDSQIFAMTLLENAHIPETTYDYIVLQMINEAKEESRDSTLEVVSFSKMKLSRMVDQLEELIPPLTSIASLPEDLLNKFKTIVDQEKRLLAHRQIGNEHSIANISLDKASSALLQLKRDIATTVHRRSLLGQRQRAPGSSNFGKLNTKKQRIPAGQGPKANTECRACGLIGHWWRDRPECREKMKQMRLARQIAQQRGDSSKPTHKPVNDKLTDESETDNDVETQADEKSQQERFFVKGVR